MQPAVQNTSVQLCLQVSGAKCVFEVEREREMNMNEELFSPDVSLLCLNNACLLRKPDRCILIWSQTLHLQLWLFLCSVAHVIAYLWLLTISQVTFITREGLEHNQTKPNLLTIQYSRFNYWQRWLVCCDKACCIFSYIYIYTCKKCDAKKRKCQSEPQMVWSEIVQNNWICHPTLSINLQFHILKYEGLGSHI